VTQPPDRHDVVVVGAGPAGLALASACTQQGLETLIVNPGGLVPFKATYGIWTDELQALDLAGTSSHHWDTTVVSLEGESIDLERGYDLIDNDLLHSTLLGRANADLLQVHDGAIHSAEHSVDQAVLRTQAGEEIRARLVFDASGWPPVIAHTSETHRTPATQVAYGMVGSVEGEPGEQGVCTLMDWSWVTGDARTPTFAYTMDLGDGRWFVEETQLATRAPLSMEELGRRLGIRLNRAGGRVRKVERTEEVRIALGTPLPYGDDEVVAFGAAASLVHPATGYHLAIALAAADGVARAAGEALANTSIDARTLAHDINEVVWPAQARQRRVLEMYGLEVMCRLDLAEIRAFFRAFFDTEPSKWRAYLSGTASVDQIRDLMLDVARRVPWDVRAKLLAPALRDGKAAARAALS